MDNYHWKEGGSRCGGRGGRGLGAVGLVRAIVTVVVAVAHPRLQDAALVFALESIRKKS